LSTSRYTFSFLFRTERFRSLPLEKPFPKGFSSNHKDPPPGEHYLQPVMGIVDVRFYPSILSSSRLLLGATQTRERACHCLAARSPANLDVEVCRSYLNDSPSLLRLKHPPFQKGTARPMAAAKDVPGLVTTFTLMVTLLGGPTSTPLLYVQASRPGIVSARQDVRFLGHETRSVPLPKSNGFSTFGTVSIRAYSQALSRLSWLSFSSPGFSPGRRSWSPRFHLLPDENSPREPG